MLHGMILHGMIEFHENRVYLGILEVLDEFSEEQTTIMLNNLVVRLEKKLGVQFKGPRYTKFKDALEFLEEKRFIRIYRRSTTKYCEILPAGKIYLEHGRYVSLSPILGFLIDPLLYLYVFLFATTPFLVFAALTHHLDSFFLAPDFFVLLVVLLNTPLLNRFYLHPLIYDIYGINLPQGNYDLFHPVMVYLANTGHEFQKNSVKAIILSALLSFLTISTIYYLPLLNTGFQTLGQYGIPIETSPLIMAFNLFLFPLANFTLYTTFYIMGFTGYWLVTRPLLLPPELFFERKNDVMDLHWRILIVSTFVYVGAEYLAIYNIMPHGAYPYKSVFIIVVFIVFGTSSIIYTLWVLTYLRLKAIFFKQEKDVILESSHNAK